MGFVDFGGSLRGEMWGWVLFYAGIAAAAFGSAYYHLKPDDDRVIWDKLPVRFYSLLGSQVTIELSTQTTHIDLFPKFHQLQMF